MIEPFAMLLALLPLIGYLLILGSIRVLGQTLVTTGSRDIAALGVAISGLVAIGPMELFFPNAAATVFGPWVWVALIAFYSLLVALVALTSTPKLVIYGRTPDELYKPLLAASQRIDSKAKAIDGLRVHLPSVGVHFRLDGYRDVDFAQVIAFEPGVPSRVWAKLLAGLRDELQELPAPATRHGHVMLLFAGLLIGILLWQGIGNSEQVVQGFREWLWR
ncbi:MAG: hypothetical protein HKN47_23630 [Pirellulaceae bacterium]|nr:hypothetical protein [Pirellulaceae bacterium]